MRHQPICDDRTYIAESFRLDSEYIGRMSKLASFKINSYKLALVNSAFDLTKEELGDNIRNSLMNCIDPYEIVSITGFWQTEIDN
jgi:hypothetical protein